MKKIAILGGGVGAMTAAFQLTNTPGWQDDYEITIYQMGWRLGGKGASGRDQEVADRIYEHGLHIWMGFYENAFAMMRAAYGECQLYNLMPGSVFTSVETAFTAQNFTPIMENVQGQWQVWPVTFPTNNLEPGIGGFVTKNGDPFTLWDAGVELMRMVIADIQSHIGGGLFHVEPGGTNSIAPTALPPTVDATLLRQGAAQKGAQLQATVDRSNVYEATDSRTSDTFQDLLKDLQDFLSWFGTFMKPLIDTDASVRHVFIMVDCAVALLNGIVNDNLWDLDFAKIDDYDFIEWLAKNGAQQAQSPISLAFYDACFAYRHGVDAPSVGHGAERQGLNMAAGTALYGALRLIATYKGSIMWRMNAGMGDTIFSPLYFVLKHRGVNFEFFNKVTALHPGKDATGNPIVSSIDIEVQATVTPAQQALGGYNPVYLVNGVYAWPSEPFFDQLVEGEALKSPTLQNPCLESWWTDWKSPVPPKTLNVGTDFDLVILGTSIGPLPYIAPELIAANTSWQNMVQNVETVRTQAAQLWLNQTMSTLGWSLGGELGPVLTSFVEPHDTWAEMGHLIPRESWTPADNVQTIAYFCNSYPNAALPPFTDYTYPARELAAVETSLVDYLNTQVPLIWPGAAEPGASQFKYNALVNRTKATGPAAIVSQFFRVNIDPSELYVQSIAGSTPSRLPSGASGFGNLYLAGDWTATFLNIGCVEAATISGMMASQAICGQPATIAGAFGLPSSTNGDIETGNDSDADVEAD